MIHIKYKLDRSSKHGIGLFADENIRKGTLVYTSSPALDVNITQEQFDVLEEKDKQENRRWGFFDKHAHKWHVDFDVSHFINHSEEGTVTQDTKYKDAYLITTRDIEKGEELTQNYLEFESKDDLKARGINI